MKMKYEAQIKAGRDLVWATFDNPDNISRWQPTLKSLVHQAGDPRQPDSVSELIYDENGRKVVMTETVTERREPQFLAGIYDNARATMLIVNHFEEIDQSTTRFVSYTNMKFKGIMKIMSLFVAKSIRTRVQANLDRFKLLAETEAAGQDQ